MTRIVTIGVVLFCLLLGAGIFLPMLAGYRATSDRVRCQDHLRRIGFAALHATLPDEAPVPTRAEQFPPGTVFNPHLPPEERLSWYVLALPALEAEPAEAAPAGKKKAPRATPLADLVRGIDLKEPWDGPHNRPVGQTRVAALLCPAGVPTWPQGAPALTQYVGLAGIGTDVVALTLEAAGKRAGVFRYDTPTPLSAITDGLSETIAIGETNRDLGPWIRGGPATVRGLDPQDEPYLGVGRPFAGLHPGGGYFGFVDTSVRFVSESVDPAVFRAQLTIAGRENREFDSP